MLEGLHLVCRSNNTMSCQQQDRMQCWESRKLVGKKKKVQALSFTLCWWGKTNKEHNLSQRADSGITLKG